MNLHLISQSQARVKPESDEIIRPESIQTRLLMALNSAPLSKTELASALGHNSISGALNMHIREMVSKKLIEYLIPDKPNSRLQKYSITGKGKALREDHFTE